MKTQKPTEKMTGRVEPEKKKASTMQRPKQDVKQDVKARPTAKPQPKTK